VGVKVCAEDLFDLGEALLKDGKMELIEAP